MCWISYNTDLKPIVADTDILVYKIGKARGLFLKRFRPIYHDEFVYKKGIPAPLVKIKPVFNDIVKKYEIAQGYHSFICPDDAIDYVYKLGVRNYDIGVFIIPKGTVYYINPAYEVVSESLVYLYKYPKHLHSFWIDRFRRLLCKTYYFQSRYFFF